MDSDALGPISPEAMEFVRFCYRRRPVDWPDLYDEMWLVASRRLFQGWGPAELAAHGIGFGLTHTAGLAALVRRVVRDERRRGGQVAGRGEALVSTCRKGADGAERSDLGSDLGSALAVRVAAGG
jgi:hypothetical protein